MQFSQNEIISLITSNEINYENIISIYELVSKLTINEIDELFKIINNPVLLIIILNTLHKQNNNAELAGYNEIVINNLREWNKINPEHVWFVICDLPLQDSLRKIIKIEAKPYYDKLINELLSNRHIFTFEKKQHTILKDAIIELLSLEIRLNVTQVALLKKRKIFIQFLINLTDDELNQIFFKFIENYKKNSVNLEIFIQIFTEVISNNPNRMILVMFFKLILKIDCKLQQSIFNKNDLPAILKNINKIDQIYNSLEDAARIITDSNYANNLFFIIRNMFSNLSNIDYQLQRSIICKDYNLNDITIDNFILWISSYKWLLINDPGSNYNALFVNQLAEVVENLAMKNKNELINRMPPFLVTNLIEYVIKNINHSDIVHADSCKQLISWLSSIHLLQDKAILEIIYDTLGKEDLALLSSCDIQNVARKVLNDTNKTPDELTKQGIWIQRLVTSPLFIENCSEADYITLLERYKILSVRLKKHEMHAASQERKIKILNFMIEEALREILETAKINVYESNNSLAINKLNNIIFHQMQSISDSYWYKIKQNIYNRFLANQSDLVKSKHLIYSWLDIYCKEYNFFQKEIINKNSHEVFDANGNKLGIINSRNYFLNNNGNLYEAEANANLLILYNKQNCKIGFVENSGKVIYTTIFDKDCAVNILEKTSVGELGQSLMALDLLIIDLFREGQWQNLHNKISKDLDKNFLIMKRIKTIFLNNNNFFQSYMIYKQIFNSNLQDKTILSAFFEKNSLADVLCEIIIEHNQNITVLYENIMWHYIFFNKNNIHIHMLRALKRLANNYPAQWDQCILALINNDAMLQHIMSDWLSILNTGELSSRINEFTEQFLELFNIKILVNLINSSNKNANWLVSRQHELILMLLYKKLDYLYSNETLDDYILMEINIFISRYFVNQFMLEDLKLFLNKILPVLSIQSAVCGQNLSKIKSTNYLLYKFDAEYFNNLQSISERILIKLNINTELSWKCALIDSWKSHKLETHSDNIDFLSLFLLNYQGTQENLKWLLKYILSDQSLNFHPVIVNNVTNIMILLQNKHISNVICEQIERVILVRPELLTHIVFKNILKQKEITDLDYIKQLGQKKEYDLVIKSCNISQNNINKSITFFMKIKKFFGGYKSIDHKLNLLKNIHNEAITENILQKHKTKWWFGIYKTIKRFFTYFFRDPTGFIKLCDESSSPKKILLPSPSQSEKKALVLKEYQEINKFYKSKLQDESPAKIFTLVNPDEQNIKINYRRRPSMNI